MSKAATLIYGLFTNSRGQYIDARGRFVGARQIRDIIDRDIDATSERLQSLAAQLREGRISIDYWANAMAVELKHLHLANLAAAKGGVKNLTQADYGRVGRILRKQYEYLNRFATLVSSNPAYVQTPEFMRRVGFYAQAARTTYEVVRHKEEIARGAKWARRVLHSAEHCMGCVAAAAQGWIPVEQMVPIGGFECNVHCHCTIEYSYEVEKPALDARERKSLATSYRRLQEEEERRQLRRLQRSRSREERLPADAAQLLRAFGSWGEGDAVKAARDPLALLPDKAMRRLVRHANQGMPEVQFMVDMESARVVDFEIGEALSVGWNEDAGRIFGNVLSAHSHPNARPPSGHDWAAMLSHSYFRHVAVIAQGSTFVLSKPRNWQMPAKAPRDVHKRFEEIENIVLGSATAFDEYEDAESVVVDVMHKVNRIMAAEYGIKYQRKELK
jgi:hypothetical protein